MICFEGEDVVLRSFHPDFLSRNKCPFAFHPTAECPRFKRELMGTALDGSVMKIKVAPSNANRAATGGKIKKVRQGGTELDLDLEDGTTLKIITAEETSSVMLRDKAGEFEYSD